MADENQLEILKQGVAAWNEWRRNEGAHVVVDLGGANLSQANLSGANLIAVSHKITTTIRDLVRAGGKS
jgi:hypothetical protein